MCASAVRTTEAAEEGEKGEIVLYFATKLMHDAVFIKTNARSEERRKDFEMKTEISTQQQQQRDRERARAHSPSSSSPSGSNQVAAFM